MYINSVDSPVISDAIQLTWLLWYGNFENYDLLDTFSKGISVPKGCDAQNYGS